MNEVILCCTNEDLAAARLLADAVERARYRTWFNEASSSDFWESEEVIERIGEAPAAICLWSRAALSSALFRSEANAARQQNKLIQVSIDGAIPPAPFDRSLVAMLSDWKGDTRHAGWQMIEAQLGPLCGSRAGAPSNSASLLSKLQSRNADRKDVRAEQPAAAAPAEAAALPVSVPLPAVPAAPVTVAAGGSRPKAADWPQPAPPPPARIETQPDDLPAFLLTPRVPPSGAELYFDDLGEAAEDTLVLTEEYQAPRQAASSSRPVPAVEPATTAAIAKLRRQAQVSATVEAGDRPPSLKAFLIPAALGTAAFIGAIGWSDRPHSSDMFERTAHIRPPEQFAVALPPEPARKLAVLPAAAISKPPASSDMLPPPKRVAAPSVAASAAVGTAAKAAFAKPVDDRRAPQLAASSATAKKIAKPKAPAKLVSAKATRGAKTEAKATKLAAAKRMPRIKYRYSENMRLFCQGPGRTTSECRRFRRTAPKWVREASVSSATSGGPRFPD